jgi:hypothetical protein
VKPSLRGRSSGQHGLTIAADPSLADLFLIETRQPARKNKCRQSGFEIVPPGHFENGRECTLPEQIESAGIPTFREIDKR